jgi:deoxycytidylate deaminase
MADSLRTQVLAAARALANGALAAIRGIRSWGQPSQNVPTEPIYTELVFGLVAPVGTHLDRIEPYFERGLAAFGYAVNKVRLSDLARNFKIEDHDLPAPGVGREYDRLTALMSHGDALRERSGKGEFLALAAAQRINESRGDTRDSPRLKTAHVLRSLKHPEEVLQLRRIYGIGFFLIGVTVDQAERRRFLKDEKNCSDDEIDKLLKRDEHEEGRRLGQRTRDTFHLADAFVPLDDEKQLKRFLNLVFGSPFETPTSDEQAMFTAFTASLRSADLSRQVGAAIVSSRGDIVAVGANDVPKAGGGQYWPGEGDARDHVKGEDSNEIQREKILDDVLMRLLPAARHDGGVEPTQSEWLAAARPLLNSSLLMDITEYGRAVHAEMEALLACGRSGVGAAGGTLFSTTFPCHNCAKHIVASGLQRVVYVEPYPKSQALELFPDSIRGEAHTGPATKEHRVIFEPFVGVGPRRYYDLFSMSLSSGYAVKRKGASGKKIAWDAKAAYPRVPLLPSTYIEREQVATERLLELTAEPTERKP